MFGLALGILMVIGGAKLIVDGLRSLFGKKD